MRTRLSLLALFVALTPGMAAAQADDRNVQLNQLLERNAAASAYARACGEEPTAEQLKTSTMLLLALTGLDSQTVQLGSGKFNDVMRQELAGLGKKKDEPLDCTVKMKDARERLAQTNEIIRATRKP